MKFFNNYYYKVFLFFFLLYSNFINAQSYNALVIGTSDYKGNWQDLKSPVNDAEALTQILLEDYNFENVKLLTNETATKENISKSINFFMEELIENDHFLIFIQDLLLRMKTKVIRFLQMQRIIC